jgi:hypothetical protein
MDKIKAFLAKYSITTHSLAAGVAILVTLYASVPAFHDLVVSAYAAMPSWAHKVVTAAIGIWAFYQGSGKSAGPQ